jgi:hypothetical protein
VQVLHLCAVVAPNHDTTFSMSIVWTAVQLLCSSFFLNFSQVGLNSWRTVIWFDLSLLLAQKTFVLRLCSLLPHHDKLVEL